jgi:hypothetical protein
VEKKDGIETFDERVELENEMEEVIRQYRDLLWGDDEGNFYKREMFLLFDRMNRLHEEVHDILLHKEDQVYYAVMISWAEMFDEEKEYAQTILELIEDELKNGPVFYWNVGWDAKDEEQIGSYRDILCVENEADHVKMIDMIQSVSEKFQDPQTREIIDGILSYYISPCKVKKCRVCLYWEDVDNFSFDSEGNVFACHQSWNCL